MRMRNKIYNVNDHANVKDEANWIWVMRMQKSDQLDMGHVNAKVTRLTRYESSRNEMSYKNEMRPIGYVFCKN